MATIKKNGNFILLKSGKVSCSCCNECNEFFNNDKNVFQITQEEYLAYKNGGTWQILAQIDVVISGEIPGYVKTDINASIFSSYSTQIQGCLHEVLQIGQGQYTETNEYFYQDAPPPQTINRSQGMFYGLTMRLKKLGSFYYAKFTPLVLGELQYAGKPFRGFSEYLNPAENEYPNTISATVNGNSLEIYKRGHEIPFFVPFGADSEDDIIYFTTYSETSSASLVATFTPNL